MKNMAIAGFLLFFGGLREVISQPSVTWLRAAGDHSFMDRRLDGTWSSPALGGAFSLSSQYLSFTAANDTVSKRVEDVAFISLSNGVEIDSGLAVSGQIQFIRGQFWPYPKTSLLFVKRHVADSSYFGLPNGTVSVLTAVQGGIFAAGGFTRIGRTQLPGAARFDLATKQWQTLPALNGIRVDEAAAKNNALFLIGRSEGNANSAVWRLESGTRTELSGTLQHARFTKIAAANGLVYVFGTVKLPGNSDEQSTIVWDGTSWLTAPKQFQEVHAFAGNPDGRFWIAGKSGGELLAGYFDQNNFVKIGNIRGTVQQIVPGTDGDSATFFGDELVVENRTILGSITYASGAWQFSPTMIPNFSSVSGIKTNGTHFLIDNNYGKVGFTDSTLTFQAIDYTHPGELRWMDHPTKKILKLYSSYTGTEVLMEVDGSRIFPFFEPSKVGLDVPYFDGAFAPDGRFVFFVSRFTGFEAAGIYAFENNAITKLCSIPEIAAEHHGYVSQYYQQPYVYFVGNRVFLIGEAAYTDTFTPGQWLFAELKNGQVQRFSPPQGASSGQLYQTRLYPFGNRPFVHLSEIGSDLNKNYVLENNGQFSELAVKQNSDVGYVVGTRMVGNQTLVFGTFTKLGNTETRNAALISGDSIYALSGFSTLGINYLALLPNGTLAAASEIYAYTTPNGLPGKIFYGKLTGLPTAETPLERPENESKETVSVTAFPNPFNPETRILVNLLHPGNLDVSVFDLTGRKLQTLANGTFPAGKKAFVFQAANYPSGVYFVRINHNGNVHTRKITLVK